MKKCDRCGGDAPTWQMSRFNTQECCLVCIAREKKHPSYQEACDVERAECEKGNYNFEGIGLPRDLEVEYLVILSPQWDTYSPNDGTVFLGHVQGLDHYYSPDKQCGVQVMSDEVLNISVSLLRGEPLDKKSDTRILMEMCGVL